MEEKEVLEVVGGGGRKNNCAIIIYKFSLISIFDKVDQVCFMGVHPDRNDSREL